MTEPRLHDILTTPISGNDGVSYKGLIPQFVYSNLNQKFIIRPYQQEAIGRFVYYTNNNTANSKNSFHLLFQMATGSGKTLVMAALIIYLHQKGYRNFLFFVNSSTIIDKTRDNFLNTASSKYLFGESVIIGCREIRIREVNNFQMSGNDDINIVFSTIQGLHSTLNTPKENCVTYEDFQDKKIVLISDEAHHINAETKRGQSKTNDEAISWEGTVNRIFKSNNENVLLEFTATADLSMPEIARKYNSKLLFDYSLSRFRRDGYSKEVKLLQADMPLMQRTLIALLLSQYRKKLFAEHGSNIKPVILFKSKTIRESQHFHDEFLNMMNKISDKDLDILRNSEKNDILKKAFEYFEKDNISNENLASELQEEFSQEKLLIVNSREDSEQKQLAVNSLEDENNCYRAIFAVDKLNEGWDVLNLFDIVRLYETKQAGNSRTTVSEAQLIGRGARYCPFHIESGLSITERKFDDDPEHPLKICEELYYHCSYNPAYINELSHALEDIGITRKQGEFQSVNKKFKPAKKIEPDFEQIRKKIYSASLFSDDVLTGEIARISSEKLVKEVREIKLCEIHPLIVRKAMNKLGGFQFMNLKSKFKNLSSVTEFINSPEYLKNVHVRVSGSLERLVHLSPDDKLEISVQLLQSLATEMDQDNIQ